jgi:hypothetical protein
MHFPLNFAFISIRKFIIIPNKVVNIVVLAIII